MSFSYILAASLLSIPFMRFFQTDLKLVAAIMGCVILMDLAFAAIFTVVGMLNQSKPLVAVISIIGVLVFMFAAVYMTSRLNEPETYGSYTYIGADGVMQKNEAEPNPLYVKGAQRDAYEFVLDFLPTGQAMQLSNMAPRHLPRLPICSLFLITATTAGGLYFFRIKDIK